MCQNRDHIHKMKLILIIGTRPEIIRASLIVQYLKGQKWLEFQVWATGQHYDYDMSTIFEDEMNIHPDLNFHVGSGSSMKQLAKIMVESEKAFVKYKPDLVLVIGDTNSTLGVTLASKKLDIPIAHIEAGPREQSYDGIDFHREPSMTNYPEEINRIIIDNCSEILFASTKDSIRNLRREHNLGKIVFVGDMGYDVLLQTLHKIRKYSKTKKYNLVTLHRAENIDNQVRFKEIIDTLTQLKIHTIFPMHPRTRKALKNAGITIENNFLHICEPVGYYDMIRLMLGARYILTDSGGIQREAFLLKVPCLTLRRNSGWVETIKCGANKLIDCNDIINELNTTPSFPSCSKNIFGDGNATSKIVEYIRKWWESK